MAVGIDATARGVVQGNSIDRGGGWAIQMESHFSGNLVQGNWVNDTDGMGVGSCDATAIWIGRETAGLGEATVAWNDVRRTNGTGIRACGAKALTYVHNNTVANDRPVEAGITLHGGAGGLLRVENNTVSGYEMGIWVKATYTPHDIGRNVLTNNTEGIRVGIGGAAFGYAWAEFHDNVITGNGIGVNVSTADWVDPKSGTPSWYAAKATLRNNTIANNTAYGVLVGAFITHEFSPPPLPSWAEMVDNNTISGNPYGVYLKGTVWNGTLIPVWADVHDNNTFSGNAYGVWLDADTVDLSQFRLWWNDVRGNGNQGVHVEGTLPGPDYFHAECNWWNSVDGPYDPIPPPAGEPDWNDNPDPNAEPVSDWFWYREPTGPPDRLWYLDSPADTDSVCRPP